jgi:catechol 2,3-dioxygenase-like lactoylglutathione lyase family enzyme
VTAEQLHHVLVLTDDLEATRSFYCDALGFEVDADRPPLPFTGLWLTLGGEACVHAAERSSYEAFAPTLGLAAAGGPVEHVAFRREGYEELAGRLEAAGVEAVRNEVPGTFRQLFVTDPNGLRIELNVPD